MPLNNNNEHRLVGVLQAAAQFVLLIVLIVLVSIFYERRRPEDAALASMSTWYVGLEPCAVGEVGCRNCSGGLLFYQHNATLQDRRLFASVGVPLLVLAPQVITAAFYMCYVRLESPDNQHPTNTNLQKNLKRIALAVQFVFAACFLLIRSAWRIPGDNLLLVEVWLLCSIFYIMFHPASHYSQNARHHYTPTRFLEFAFTLPLLSIAAVASCGLADVDDLNWVFFTSLFMCFFVIAIEFHNHKRTVLKQEPLPEHFLGSRVLHVNAWLCLIAFLIPCSRATEQGPGWGTAAAVLVMVFHILYMLCVTCFTHLGYEYHARFITALDCLSLGGKCAICITIVGGCLSVGGGAH